MDFSEKEAQSSKAEEYREKAQAHKQAYKDQWKTFLKSGVFVLAALVAILALSVAWFQNNSKVNTVGVEVSVGDASFELRSYGKNGIYDDMLSKFFQSVTVKGEDETSPFTTSATKSSINWLVSENSSIGNYSETDVDFSKTDSDRKDYAIEPGSAGELTFYIVPKVNGTQTFHLNLAVSPYAAEVKESTNEITAVTEVGLENSAADSKYAKQFLTGHVLFFLESKNADANTGYSWIKDGSFDVTITDAAADSEYAYTIYWKWPQVFSEVILNENDGYLNDHTPILTSALREEILTDMIANPQKYFYNSLTRSPLKSTDSLVSGEQGIADIHDKSPNSGNPDGYNAQNFVDLSSFYNQADQIIGSQISFIVVELSAEAGGTAE